MSALNSSAASWLFLLWLGASPVAWANFDANRCLIGFATLSEDATPEVLTATTYLDLIERLGGPLDSATMERMLNSENPFEVPVQSGSDLGALRRYLLRLQEMVKEKGWFRPEVVAEVRNHLRRHLQSRKEADKVQKDLIPDLELDVVAPLTVGPAVQSPDGRWLLATTRKFFDADGTPWDVQVFDTKTRQLRVLPGATFFAGYPDFSPDGKHVLFPGKFHEMRSVPFHDGVLDWSGAKKLGRPVGDNDFGEFSYGQDQSRLLVGNHTNLLHLFSLTDGAVIPIESAEWMRLGEMLRGGNRSVGFVPGTDELYLRVQSKPLGNPSAPSGERLSTFKILPNGRLELKRVVWDRPAEQKIGYEGNETQFFFLRDGRAVVVARDEKKHGVDFYVGEPAQKLSLSLQETLGPSFKIGGLDLVVAHSKRAEAAILLYDETRDHSWIVHYDLDQKRVTHAYETSNNARSIRYWNNGDRVLVLERDGALRATNPARFRRP